MSFDPKRDGEWFVYQVAVSGEESKVFLRIGIAHDTAARVAELQRGCPLPIDQVCLRKIGPYAEAQSKAQSILSALHPYHGIGGWIVMDMTNAAHKKALKDACERAFGAGWKWAIFDLAEVRAAMMKKAS